MRMHGKIEALDLRNKMGYIDSEEFGRRLFVWDDIPSDALTKAMHEKQLVTVDLDEDWRLILVQVFESEKGAWPRP